MANNIIDKRVDIQRRFVEQLQNVYGPDFSLSFVVDTLLEAYCDLLKSHEITIESLKKDAVQNADTILREQ